MGFGCVIGAALPPSRPTAQEGIGGGETPPGYAG